jgi:hypothetical protein
MKKGAIIFALLIAFMPFVFADTPDDLAKVQKAYACLKDKIDSKTDISLQEATFSILASGNNAKAVKKLDDEKNQNCWPKSSCNLKETSQALLAYKMLGKNIDDVKSYLISKNASATGLNWFLVMDIPNRVSSSCTISYSGSQGTLSIGEDMKLSGNPGSCFSVVSSGFWLQVSQSCLDYKFTISCDQDFVTTLLYQESDSDIIFLSSETKGAASSGEVEQSINAKCFRIGGECDYEGSLWATLALSQTGQDVSSFIPYLAAASSNYPNLFPAAFLYKLTGQDEYYSTISQDQKSSQYWQAPNSNYNKFYDTALALLALQGKTALEATNSKSYLLSVQSSNGCWNNDNLRDTAFLLYTGWPNQQTQGYNTNNTGNTTGGGGGTTCAFGGYYCVPSSLQCVTAGGQTKSEYVCSGASTCCTVAISQQTCSQKSGRICPVGQTCSTSTVPSSDGSCCLGTCGIVQDTRSACEIAGGQCFSSCNANEEVGSESCTSSSLLCCKLKSTTDSTSAFSNTWIIILVILVLLVLLGIVFRNKLRVLLFKIRRPGSVSSTPLMMRRPPFPPSYPGTLRPAPPRQFSQQPPVKQAARPSARPKDDEMEETLRKLRELSK